MSFDVSGKPGEAHTVLREHSSCFAIALTLVPLRAMTRISTACSWVNISSPEMAAILPQVGHFYFGAVGQYYFGANTCVWVTTEQPTSAYRYSSAETGLS